MDATRRTLLAAAALFPAVAHAEKKGEKKDDDVPPIEDLMREHGVIRRDLGVYEELARRIEAGGEPPKVDVLTGAVELMRRFAEGYHEKLEETQLFPRLEKAKVLVELCATLRAQHAAGRQLNADVLELARSWSDAAKRTAIAGKLRGFVHMYQAHAAREDTEAFIAFRKVVGPNQLDKLGDEFEEQEHKLLGENGFEKALAEVEQLEKSLGIDDLARFTVR